MTAPLTIVRKDTSTLLRQGLIGLALLGSVAGLVELATLRHWGNLVRVIPWIVLVALAAMAVAMSLRPRRSTILVTRLAAVVSMGSAAFGVFEHAKENYSTAPLDRIYGPLWDSMSTMSRVWASVNGSVGPSPLLAPGLLAQVGLCLLLATVHHPANHRTSPGT